MAKHYHCPVNGWDCPYYENEPNHPCVCTMEDPYEDCEDFHYMWEGIDFKDECADDHD